MRTDLRVAFVHAVVLLLATSAPAHAYLDPGTGSMILQGLLAGIAGALVVGKLYWLRLKQFFSSLFARQSAAEEQPEESPEKAES